MTFSRMSGVSTSRCDLVLIVVAAAASPTVAVRAVRSTLLREASSTATAIRTSHVRRLACSYSTAVMNVPVTCDQHPRI